ncbi:MAG: acyltransferase family protein [bacterium]
MEPSAVVERRKNPHLDLLRGLLALAVFLGHARGLFLVDDRNIAHVSVLTKGLYFFTGFGTQAVLGFFVLSGLLISSSIFEACDTNRWSSSRYLVNRLTRLLVVLVPALVLTAMWDQAGMARFGVTSVYGGNPSAGNVVEFAVAQRSSALTFLGNVLFLQQIAVPAFGSNSALWSLGYEFWYYIAFPLGWFALATAQRMPARIGLLALGTVVVVMLGPSGDLGLVLWIMGAAATFVVRRPALAQRVGRVLPWWLTLPLYAAVLTMLRFHGIRSDSLAELVAGAACALFVSTLVNRAAAPAFGRAYESGAKFLAEMSYTLYAVHLPLLVFLQAWLVRSARWQPDAAHLARLAGIVLLVFAYAFAVSRLTEARTDDVRRFVLRSVRPASMTATARTS